MKEEYLEIYGELREEVGMKTYLHGPMDYAKTLKLRFRVGEANLPEGRKRYASSREGGEVDAQMCPCGKATESRTHRVGEYEIYIGWFKLIVPISFRVQCPRRF